MFDEERYFQPGNECPVFEINGVQVGVNVCEDIWHEEGPSMVQRGAGAEVIVNINASPYHRGKGRQREDMLAARARTHGAYIAYLNTVGGQDRGSCSTARASCSGLMGEWSRGARSSRRSC